MDRHWKEAKIPAWASTAISAEIDAWKLTAALSWPREAKPEPLPFRWGDYDRLFGTPVAGEYWAVIGSRMVHFYLRPANELLHKTWKTWAFSDDGEKWTDYVVRGPLFATERDARLFLHWKACEDSAKLLMEFLQ